MWKPLNQHAPNFKSVQVNLSQGCSRQSLGVWSVVIFINLLVLQDALALLHYDYMKNSRVDSLTAFSRISDCAPPVGHVRLIFHKLIDLPMTFQW